MGVKIHEYPKSSSKYWLYIHHKGKRKKKYCGLGKQGKKTAQEAAKQISVLLKLPDADLSKLYKQEEKAMTLKEYAEKLLIVIKKTREISTYVSHRDNVENHILPALGNKPLNEISKQDAKSFILSKFDEKKITSKYKKDDGKTLRASTVHNIFRTVRYIMNCAIEDDLIQKNPFEKIGRLISLKKTKDNINPLDKYDVPLFLYKVKEEKPEWYAFFLTAVRAGLRLGELTCLKLDDLDFVNRFILVRRTERKDRTVKDTTKTGKTRRVDMSIELTETLKSHKFDMELQYGSVDWVFVNSSGNRIDGSKARIVFKECLKSAGLRVIRLHDLRHSYASLLIQNGASLAYIKEQMGHSSIQTTVDVYGHLVPGANRHEVDKIDEILAENAPYTHPPKKEELQETLQPIVFNGAPRRSRTPNLLIRSQTLYPIEL